MVTPRRATFVPAKAHEHRNCGICQRSTRDRRPSSALQSKVPVVPSRSGRRAPGVQCGPVGPRCATAPMRRPVRSSREHQSSSRGPVESASGPVARSSRDAAPDYKRLSVRWHRPSSGTMILLPASGMSAVKNTRSEVGSYRCEPPTLFLGEPTFHVERWVGLGGGSLGTDK